MPRPDHPEAEHRPVRIGVSACLLGEKVRFDGGHKRDAFLTETLGPHVEWVPVCPEVEMGLGAPRPSLRLSDAGGAVRLVAPRTGTDHTDAMLAFCDRRLAELDNADLCGYVLKKGSPTCGMERVRIYGAAKQPPRPGRGRFAAALMSRYPDLPVEEEGRLCDPRLRENFVERVFAYRRLKDCFRPGWRSRHLVAFHAAHKLVLLAHSPEAYRHLGRVVARAGEVPPHELEATYRSGFMNALSVPATRGRHVNVLQHMLGYFKERLDPAVRAEILETIEDYGRGLVPLIVPVTLIRHYVRGLDVGYLRRQAYLEAHPKELMLRNHV